MIDFERCMRPITLAHLDKTGQRKDAGVTAEIQLPFFVAGLTDIDYGIADMNDGCSAFCEWSEEIDKLLGYSPFPIGQVRGWRGQFQTVFEIDTPDPDRLEHMLIF
jgi:hypothetical protein